jgi:hypothetical protein
MLGGRPRRATLRGVSPHERFWPSRLRWRLRGALQWPAFVVLTLIDAIVLDALPPVSTTGMNFIVGVLVAASANLFLIGAVSPWLTRRLVERRAAALQVAGAPPPTQAAREVLQDRVATGLLVLGLAGVIASGLANRPVIVSETEDTERNAEAVRDYVQSSGDEELIRNLDTANTIRLAEGYFRTCVADDERDRFYCFFVDTSKDPAEVKRDPSAESNTAFRGR